MYSILYINTFTIVFVGKSLWHKWNNTPSRQVIVYSCYNVNDNRKKTCFTDYTSVDYFPLMACPIILIPYLSSTSL